MTETSEIIPKNKYLSIYMQSTLRSFLQGCCNKFKKLKWDRCTYDPINSIFTAYGWFYEGSIRGDFLVIELDCDPNDHNSPFFLSFVTSSVKYSLHLSQFFGLDVSNHQKCISLKGFLSGDLISELTEKK